MAELTIEAALVPWLEARDPRLKRKVFPRAATPPAAGPYCTHLRLSTEDWGHLKGQGGTTRARVELTFWSQDHAEARSVADKVAGTKASPGLRGFRGDMNGVFVQAALRAAERDDFEEPVDGSEEGWYAVRAEYRITWSEGD